MLALILAWCLVFLKFELSLFKIIFPGEFNRVLQAHIDLLMMSALLFGFYAAKVPFPWHVRWAMVVGAFTNPSMFLMQAMFPVLDTPVSEDSLFMILFRVYLMLSIITTTYGFGRGAIIIFLSTFRTMPDQHKI